MNEWQEDFIRLAVPAYGLMPVAKHLGWSYNQLRAWTWKHRVRSGNTMAGTCERVAEPTELEIQERTAEIRAGWDESEYRRRAGVVVAELELMEMADRLYF